ncbi:MAG: gpW family head-tail joining protein [Xanthobacteraceae bacterium]
MADLPTLQTWLSEAEIARHRLAIGSLRETVRYNGTQEVTFAKTDLAKLDAYIASLKSQIAALEGNSPASRNAPIHLIF